MKMNTRFLIATFAFLPLSAPVLAGSTLDVKLGLWEMTTTQKMTGMPEMPALSQDMLDQMTDEQKAQMDAMMKMAAGQETTTTDQQCLTQQDLDEGALYSAEDPTCKQEIIEQSAQRVEVKATCEIEGVSNESHLVFEASNNESMTGKIEMAGMGGEGEMSMSMTLAGKWLGPDCGDVE